MHRQAIVLLLVLSIAIATVVGAMRYWGQPLSPVSGPVFPWNAQTTLATSSENNVMVTIALAKDSSGALFLIGTFTPMQEGYHLYSKDLPRSGVQGIGRPTLLELVPLTALTSRGPLAESVIAAPDPSVQLEQPLLIYPNGPVSLFLPTRLAMENTDGHTAPVLVSYMTCSDHGVCTPPVTEKRIVLTIPSELGK